MGANFNIFGLQSGIDWSNYINSIRAAEENAVARTLGARQVKLSAESTAIQGVGGQLSQLKTVATQFKTAGNWKTKIVTSSDSDVITATATRDAVANAVRVRVDRLATNETWEGVHSSINDSVTSADGTLTLNIRGTERVVNVPSGTTLSELADLINEADIGVTATVFDTGAGGATPARISIQDKLSGKNSSDQTPGVEYNISISSTLTELVDADFDADGVTPGNQPRTEGLDSLIYLNDDLSNPIYRDNNTISNVIPGLTLKLVSADNTAFKTLTVNESITSAKDRIKEFITRYNNVVTSLKRAVAFDPSQEQQSNPTAGNPTLRSALATLQSSITRELRSLPDDATIRSLSDLGVRTAYTVGGGAAASDGLLEFNEAIFDAAVNADFDGVARFFEGDRLGENQFDGFGTSIDAVLEGLVGTIDGTLSVKIRSVQNQLKRIDDEIQQKLESIVAKQERLKLRFARLESQMAQLGSQQSSLTAALNSLALNNQAIANR